MPKYKLRELIEYDDRTFVPKVLVNEPGYRMVLLNLRGGQRIPEHATKEMVTVYAICGHITFYEGSVPVDLKAGEVLRISEGVPHSLQAHEDSSLLVVAAGKKPLPKSGKRRLGKEMARRRSVIRPSGPHP